MSIFQVYPSCLAQAVYLIYRQAFPESGNKLAEDFKQELCNIVFEWITGTYTKVQNFKSDFNSLAKLLFTIG